jgi:hypothetical protein
MVANTRMDAKVSGAYRNIREVWVKVGGQYRQVAGIYAKQQGVYRNIMDFMPGRPGSLTVTQQDNSSVTLHWNAPTTGANVEAYDILRRPKDAGLDVAPTVVKTLVPADGTFWSTRTWKVTGLAQDTEYVFSVRAVNTTPGVRVLGDETSPGRKVYTGVSQRKETGSSRHKVGTGNDAEWVDHYEFQPVKADT